MSHVTLNIDGVEYDKSTHLVTPTPLDQLQVIQVSTDCVGNPNYEITFNLNKCLFITGFATIHGTGAAKVILYKLGTPIKWYNNNVDEMAKIVELMQSHINNLPYTPPK